VGIVVVLTGVVCLITRGEVARLLANQTPQGVKK
jgi:hypothetical protein